MGKLQVRNFLSPLPSRQGATFCVAPFKRVESFGPPPLQYGYVFFCSPFYQTYSMGISVIRCVGSTGGR